jgi:hypothetical protein
MIKRYKAGKYLAPCYFYSNTPSGSTSLTETFTVVVKGAPGATVYFKVNYVVFAGTSAVYTIDGDSYADGDTLNKVLDGTGSKTITIVIGFGSTSSSSQHISVDLVIQSVSIGKLGPTTASITQNEDLTV